MSQPPPDALPNDTGAAPTPPPENAGYVLWLVPELWAVPFREMTTDLQSKTDRVSLRRIALVLLATMTIIIRPVANGLSQNGGVASTVNAVFLSAIFAYVIDFLFMKWPAWQREHARLMGIITLTISVSIFIFIDSLQYSLPGYGVISDIFHDDTLIASLALAVGITMVLLIANTIRLSLLNGKAFRDMVVLAVLCSAVIWIFTTVDSAILQYMLRVFGASADQPG